MRSNKTNFLIKYNNQIMFISIIHHIMSQTSNLRSQTQYSTQTDLITMSMYLVFQGF